MRNARERAYHIKSKTEICREPFTRVLELCNIQISQAEMLGKTECFFQVPEFMFGFPLYDMSECIQFVIRKLEENDYVVRYFHPKLLFISWRLDDHTLTAHENNQEKMLIDMLNALTCEARKNDAKHTTSSSVSPALEHIPLTKPPAPPRCTPSAASKQHDGDLKVLSSSDDPPPSKRGRKPTRSVHDIKSHGKLTLDLTKL